MKYRFFISGMRVRKIHVFGKLIQFICGLIGHSFDADWGYGGGDYADVWCRHCDFFTQIPKTSIWFKRRFAKEMMAMVGKELK